MEKSEVKDRDISGISRGNNKSMQKYVSVVHNKNATHPQKPPFDPPVAWPECPFLDCIDPTNDAY